MPAQLLARSLLIVCASLLGIFPCFAQEFAPAPAPVAPAPAPPVGVMPPHWFERQQVLPVDQIEPYFGRPDEWVSLGELYLRVDGGWHKEPGFPEREGIGLEADGRLRLPHAPWLSLVGELRDEILFGSNRFSWTVGGVAEYELLTFAAGIDGIYDSETSTHVGSGFVYLSRAIPELRSSFGAWATFEVWNDLQTYTYKVGPKTLAVTQVGVTPIDQACIFFATELGPDACWGVAYVAPGIQTDDGRFRLSAGYQVTFLPGFDAFVQYYETFDHDRDWSLFAGVQLHLGCGSSLPFDFAAPQRIRARQQWVGTTYFYPLN